MPGGNRNLPQTVFHIGLIVYMGVCEGRHPHDGVHWGTDIVAHGREECCLCLVCLFCQLKGVFQLLFGFPLGHQHFGHIRAYNANSLMVPIAPQDIDFFVSKPFLSIIRTHKIVAQGLLLQLFQYGGQFELTAELLSLLLRFSIIIHRCRDLRVIILHNIRRQILQHRLTGMHDHPACCHINKTGQLKRIGQHIQQALLLPYRLRYIRSGQTHPPQPRVDGKNGDRIIESVGPAFFQAFGHISGVQIFPVIFLVFGNDPVFQHIIHPAGV